MAAMPLATLAIGCSGPEDVPTQDDKPTNGIFIDDTKAMLPPGETLRALHTKGLKLTKLSEGWVPRLYNDAAGYCTIGFGHLIDKRRCNASDTKRYPDAMPEAAGTTLLLADMEKAQVAVQSLVPNHRTLLNDTQFASLCDFVFNVGANNFAGSTLLKVVKERRFDSVPAQLRRWVLSGGKEFKGLKTRREREIELFFDGMETPKAMPRPEEDLSPLDISRGPRGG
jgi:lysozyme